MKAIGKISLKLAALFLFWILVFDFQRILFSIHNWNKFSEVSFLEYLGVFVHSIRLDLAMAAILSAIPLIFLSVYLLWSNKWFKRLFILVLLMEVVICAFIHAGEINAYPEWNHKLTSRVFMHLSNPDEVFKTADYGMTIWFIVYSLFEIVFGWKLMQWMFFRKETEIAFQGWKKAVTAVVVIPVFLGASLLLARGGFQQIPINIDAAYFSKNYTTNDLSVNSTYFFMKSYLLYNRSEIDEFISDMSQEEAEKLLQDFYDYPLEHDRYFLQNERPNIVFIILESWTANAIGSLTGEPSATPHFDQLTKEGILFTHLYATGGTSEIGNSSIFSGYPALPEISISMQPDKHRKLPCFNEDLKQFGYSSNYLFSGDLKYGNIGGYFTDHGFDVVEDELDFPSHYKKGKLNYKDEDFYKVLLQKMNGLQEPFMQCGFTGSTHSPYDHHDRVKFNQFSGEEGVFMNSMVYADEELWKFLEKSKQEKWYKNTLFVLVADHGHASNKVQNPSLSAYFHVPLLLIGEPIKAEYRGKQISTFGSQSDIVRTLLYQMHGNYKRYIWAKDLMNPSAPEFALHTLSRGYGWVTPKGNFSYHMDGNQYLDNSFSDEELKVQRKRCDAFMSLIYKEYKEL